MTTRTLETTAPTTALATYAAPAWLLGGLCWFAAGMTFDAADPRFTLASVLWLVADLLLVVGLLSLLQSRPHGERQLGTVMLVLALLGRAVFAAGEVHSLVRGDDHTPLLPAAALLTAVAMTAYGVVVLRARRVDGLARVAPLLMGLYPFVAMFPLVAVTDDPPVLSIAGWGLVTALVATTARRR